MNNTEQSRDRVMMSIFDILELSVGLTVFVGVSESSAELAQNLIPPGWFCQVLLDGEVVGEFESSETGHRGAGGGEPSNWILATEDKTLPISRLKEGLSSGAVSVLCSRSG